MFKKASGWFRALSTLGKMGAIGVAGLAILGVTAANNPSKPHTMTLTPASSKSTSQKPTIEHKTVTTSEAIAFTSTTVDDNTLSKGTTKITTAGIDGTRTHTYDVTYTNGKETARTEVSNVITTQPVNQITAVGTYVAPQLSCPNGTYVNSSGDTVCSPYQSSSAPAGATAQCVDGSYSFSQSRSGTCSHHGGVATWL